MTAELYGSKTRTPVSVVDDGRAGAQRLELAGRPPHRRHRRVVGDRALLLGEERHRGERETARGQGDRHASRRR